MSCSLCIVGQFSGTRAEECDNCSVGTYTAVSGEASCSECDAGSYAPQPGLGTCTPCA
jgi:hypothetical protein